MAQEAGFRAPLSRKSLKDPPPPPDELGGPPPLPPNGDAPPPPEEPLPPPPPSTAAFEEEELGVPIKPSATKPLKRKRSQLTSQRSQPPSIEEIVREKKEADAKAAKLRYIPREERERMAQEKKRKEEEERAQKIPQTGDMILAKFGISESEAFGNGTSGPAKPKKLPENRSEAAKLSDAIEKLRNKFNGGNGNKGANSPPSFPVNAQAADVNPSDHMLTKEERAAAEAHRQRYMGPDVNASKFSAKNNRRGNNEKKFVFEWREDEDTSQEWDWLYKDRKPASFFGTGRLGGYAEDFSKPSAREEYAAHIEQRDPENGARRAAEIRAMEKRRRENNNKNWLDVNWSKKPLEHMRERDWRIFKEDHNISTKGGSIPNPMRNWKESGLPERLLKIVTDDVGYAEPTPVQCAAIPIALQSRDLIGVAVTGSGKTAAFLLPLLVYIADLPPLNETNANDGPYGIILAPTRELAQQIESEAKKFARPMGFNCVSIVGGHSLEEQSFSLRDGAEIIIATPGRLVDCIERRMLVLQQCCYVIMDEADRMVDMGFEEPVNKILDALPVSNEKPDDDTAEDANAMSRVPVAPSRGHASSRLRGATDRYRQTMMYTATMPAAVDRIARKYLRRPATVTIGNAGEAVDTVEQRVEFITGEDKRKRRLIEILRDFAPPVIVFVNIKRNADAVARDLKHAGFAAVTLHGSKTQEQRESALAALRSGDASILVATDLAGRGIDVPDVSLVVNFNMAGAIEPYTHRIGRTGRAGKSGVAITFLGPEDNDVLYDLKIMMQRSHISKCPEELRRHEAAQSKRAPGSHKNTGSSSNGVKGEEIRD